MAFGERYEAIAAAPAPRAGTVVAAADTGVYAATGAGTFRLFVSDGHAYVKWVTARTAHFAPLVGRDSLVVRADRSLIVLERDASGRVTAASRSWGGSAPVRFVRTSD